MGRVINIRKMIIIIHHTESNIQTNSSSINTLAHFPQWLSSYEIKFAIQITDEVVYVSVYVNAL